MFLLICVTSMLMTRYAAAALEIPYYDVEQAEQLFEDFILTYSKTYLNQQEKQMRLEIFKDKLNMINEKNSIGGAVFDINLYSDSTSEEIEQRMGFRPRKNYYDDCKTVTDKDITTKDAPESIDWVATGAVTAVKNQCLPQCCGSCYAFATIGNIEGQYYIKHKKLVSFSVQEIVDCSKGNNGCEGGFEAVAMTDIQKIGGVESESDYPYEAKVQTCRFNSSKTAVKLAGCTKYRLSDEDKVKEVLAKRGPITIAVNGHDMYHYTIGIMGEKHCSSKGILNHAVLLVGYGTENGVNYWLIKNSWGSENGEKGYVRITRGENTCGHMNEYKASADL